MENEEKNEIQESSVITVKKKRGLKAYFYCLGKHKYWVLAFTIIGGVVGFIAMAQGVNKYRQVVESKFQVNLPLKEKDGAKVYYDDSAYSLSDFYNRKRLEAIKDSDTDFNFVYVDRISVENGISIVHEKDNQGKEIENSFVLTIKKKYFSDDAIAKKFVKRVVEDEIKYAESRVYVSVDSSIKNDDFSKLNLPNQIDKLNKAYNEISNFYVSLSNDLGFKETYSVDEEGMTLSVRKESFKAKHLDLGYVDVEKNRSVLNEKKYANLGSNSLDSMKTSILKEVDEFKIVYKESLGKISTYKTQLATETDQSRISELNKLIADEEAKISSLYNYFSYLGLVTEGDKLEIEVASDLDKLSVAGLNSNAKGVLSYLSNPTATETTTWVEGSKEFVNSISTLRTNYVADLVTLEADTSYLFKNYSENLKYTYPDIATIKYGISYLYGVGLGLLAGFLISSTIFTLYYVYSKQKKDV